MRLVRLSLLALSFWGSASYADSQNSPETLEQRLAYAQLQTETKEGDCAARLDIAQKEIGIAKANPAFDILLPAGKARLADLDYRLHLGRAYCGKETIPRQDELLSALDAALRAVPLYRGNYDYQSMVIMQYDAALTYRLLGDKDKALAALETAIGWDGDYGYTDDEAENNELLRSWKGLPPVPQPAAQQEGAPHRSITLKFAWTPLDVEITDEADYLALADGVAVPSKAAVSIKRQIRAEGDDWLLSSSELGDRHYSGLEALKDKPILMQVMATLAALQMLGADVKVSGKGEFKEDAGSEQISAALVHEIKTLSGDLLPEEKGEKEIEPTLLIGLSSQMLTRPNGIAFKAEEDYNLATSAWIDASLEQGVWYDMQASLLLPGLSVIIDHDIQFAYARSVPCIADGTGEDCAEILVHAKPNPEALEKWLNAVRGHFSLAGPDRASYASTTDLRLVVDPNRLQTYVSEMRRHWYFAIDGKGEPLIGSEKAISTYRYN